MEKRGQEEDERKDGEQKGQTRKARVCWREAQCQLQEKQPQVLKKWQIPSRSPSAPLQAEQGP